LSNRLIPIATRESESVEPPLEGKAFATLRAGGSTSQPFISMLN